MGCVLNYYLTLAMSSYRFAYYVIQRNDNTNDSIIHMSDVLVLYDQEVVAHYI